MYFAINEKGERLRPKPNLNAFCPACSQPVISKCGSVNIWHWSHESKNDCPGSREETAWHRFLKKQYPEECCEVIIQNEKGVVIADVLLEEKKTALEFDYKSQLTAEEIQQKTAIYEASGYRVNWFFKVDRYASSSLEESSNPEVLWFKHGLRRLVDIQTPFTLCFEDQYVKVASYWYYTEAKKIFLRGTRYDYSKKFKKNMRFEVGNEEHIRLLKSNQIPVKDESDEIVEDLIRDFGGKEITN